MKKKKLLAFAVLGAGLVVYGCGGGGSSTSGPTVGNTAGLATYITDAPADQFPVFEVTLYEIRLCNNTGCQVLFSDSNGMSVDLTELEGVMRYLGTSNIPAGVYTSIEVDIANSVRVVDNNGNQSTYTFTNIQSQQVSVNCTTDRCTITINTSVDTSSGRLALDFDLQNFQVDPNSGTITDISVKPVTNTTPQSGSMMIELTGLVQSVGEGSLSVTVGNEQFVLNIDENTICKGMNGCDSIQTGWCIEAEVQGDPAQSNELTALLIEREDKKGCIGEFEYEDEDSYQDSYREIKLITSPDNISIEQDTIVINDQSFSMSENVVCKVEMPGGQGEDEDMPYQVGKDSCSEMLTLMIDNARSQGVAYVEVELELDNDNQVLEIEMEVEMDREDEPEEHNTEDTQE